MQNIVSAAVLTGAEAIHPGYGFLSENADFAELCETCHITFIGPKFETIALMGNKANARIQMQSGNVPVVPGSNGFLADEADALSVAESVGYPVMLKAAAGGGGKGIRRVTSANELSAAYQAATKEAQLSFGDQRMYLEKKLCRPQNTSKFKFLQIKLVMLLPFLNVIVHYNANNKRSWN